MFTLRNITVLSLICVTSLSFSLPCSAAPVSSVVKAQLQTLMLDENDVPGFSHITPPGENPPLAGVPSPSMVTQDEYWGPYTASTDTGTTQQVIVRPEHFLGAMRRVLYSADGLYFIEMRMNLCSAEADAQEQLQQFLQDSSGVFNEGTFTGSPGIGDESKFLPADIYGSTLIFRAGNVFVMVSGRQSAGSNRNGGPSYIFPPQAVEAVAYQILLRASQYPDITGVMAQQAQVAVNGHTLPKGALLVGKQVYVPVQAFAQAMGMTSRWDTKTGALTLSGAGRKTVALRAGSVQVDGGGASLKVPVLKQAGQPIMMLEDLLTLTGGRVTGRSGNTVQVKA